MKKQIFLVLTILFFTACDSLQPILDEANRTAGATLAPSNAEINTALKEALIKGTSSGVDNLSQIGGYLDNPKVKIPFPKNAEKVKNTLIDLGMQKQVDQVVTSINRAAEDAVKEASPLFINAIREMSIADVRSILFGEDDAATKYLKSKTSQGLSQKFQPKIKTSLDKVNATKYWTDVMSTYNKVPFVDKVNTDLTAYVTDLAIEGLFLKIEEEEKAIRDNPVERTTAILKKVFGYADAQQ